MGLLGYWVFFFLIRVFGSSGILVGSGGGVVVVTRLFGFFLMGLLGFWWEFALSFSF